MPSYAGPVVVAIAVVWQGIGTALIGSRLSPEQSPVLTFLAFLAAAALAVGVRLSVRSRARPESPSIPFGLCVAINICTAGAFGLLYVAATLMPATAASVIETGVGPVAVCLATAIGVRGAARPLVVLTISAAIAALTIAQRGVDGGTALGLTLSVVAGCCAAGVLLTSHGLTRRGVPALQIASLRFHLAWLVSGLIAAPLLTRLSTGDLVGISILALTCVTLPILLLQWGITLCPPLPAAIIIATLPAVVWLTESTLDGHLDPAVAGLMVLLLAATIRRPSRARG